jgi:DNA-3-methyladenine glycosylase
LTSVVDIRDESIMPRSFFARPAEEVAPELLGRLLVRRTAEGPTVLRITEVEAYAGERDAASHAFRGRTPRNAVMFGPAGHLYVYFTYGMHFCINVVCGNEGESAAVLIRAGEIVEGADLARSRRPAGTRDRDLARGPARLTQALGLGRADNGTDLCGGGSLTVCEGIPVGAKRIRTGPRTGISVAAETPWRFWIDGDPTVSPYKAHKSLTSAAVPATTV